MPKMIFFSLLFTLKAGSRFVLTGLFYGNGHVTCSVIRFRVVRLLHKEEREGREEEEAEAADSYTKQIACPVTGFPGLRSMCISLDSRSQGDQTLS